MSCRRFSCVLLLSLPMFLPSGCSSISAESELLTFLLLQDLTNEPVETVSRTDTPLYKILPLGDSITHGDDTYNSYRRDLYFLLKNAGYNFDFVGSQGSNHPDVAPPIDDFDRDHEGHWGETADWILPQIGAWAATSQPDVVLLHLGTNDVLLGQSDADTINELSQIIDELRGANPDVIILLAQLIPHTYNLNTVEPLNTLISSLASSKNTADSPVILVDQFTGFNAATETHDKLHPNQTGEARMAQAWFGALQGVLK